MEEFIRSLETNPSGSGSGVSSSGAKELISHRSIRKVKNKKTGEYEELVDYEDIRSKTVLISPTSFTVVQTLKSYLDQTFGPEASELLQAFIDDFLINMPNKDGLARQQYADVLKGLPQQTQEEVKGLLKDLGKM